MAEAEIAFTASRATIETNAVCAVPQTLCQVHCPLALIGADQNENEPPLGGSETGEVTASLDMQSETSQGLPSDIVHPVWGHSKERRVGRKVSLLAHLNVYPAICYKSMTWECTSSME